MPNKWTPILTWTQIESAAVAAGWKRAGVEWRGPCPFCGGRDRAHVRPGSSKVTQKIPLSDVDQLSS